MKVIDERETQTQEVKKQRQKKQGGTVDRSYSEGLTAKWFFCTF